MRANWQKILEHALDVGIELGWNRAHKHVDSPGPNHIKLEIERAFWAELDEWVSFDDSPE